MKFEGEFTFQGSQEEVWKAILDPEILIRALPGAQSLERVGEDRYEAAMNVRVGPMSGLFNGSVELKEKNYPTGYTLVAEGKGGPGFAKGTADIEFIEQGPQTTLMRYNAEMEVGGKLASVGQRLIDTVGKSMIRQSLEAIDQAMQARLTGATELPQAPSQAKFAAGVAKDVGRDLAKSPVVWVVTGVTLLAIVLSIIFFSR